MSAGASSSGNAASSATFVAENVRSVFVPDELRSHPLVANRTFYTLPQQLWAEFREATRPRIPDSETTALDEALSCFAEANPGCVGYRNGYPIRDDLLRPPALRDGVSAAARTLSQEWMVDGWRADDHPGLSDRRLGSFRTSQQAYLGWLLTNQIFLDEFRTVRQQVAASNPMCEPFSSNRVWTSRFGLTSPSPQSLTESDQPSLQVRAFCCRWRLAMITAPMTLQPLGAQVIAPMPASSEGDAPVMGGCIFIPDIAPLPDRDELRAIMENAVRPPRQDEHLAEWLDLVAADTQGRRRFDRYARWFPLQHYLRVIYGRYGEQLEGARDRVAAAVANYLRLTPDQLRDDLRGIRSRLGPDWLDPANRQFLAT